MLYTGNSPAPVAFVHVEVVADTAGGEVHVHSGVNGCTDVGVGAKGKASALMRTGITAPVLRGKDWCLSTMYTCQLQQTWEKQV